MEGKLVGVHKVTVKKPNGKVHVYYYAWRGKDAPRIMSKPGTKAFTQEYIRLTKHRQAEEKAGTIGTLVEDYRQSPQFLKLAAGTRREYERMLAAIKQEFGDFPIRLIEARGSRKLFIKWRDSMKEAPRSADLHLWMLSRVFAWAKSNTEDILRNPLEDVEKLHSGSRRDIVWTNEQLDKLLSESAPHIRNVALMALWTMQRQGDILTMPTLAFDGERVLIRQGKTGALVRVTAGPDILPILRDAKAEGRQRVVVNSFGQNWTSSGFKASWRKELARLGIKGVTFHDLRGTAITYAYANMDLPHDDKIRLIAEISGHSKDDAESIIRRHYLAGHEVIDAIKIGRRK